MDEKDVAQFLKDNLIITVDGDSSPAYYEQSAHINVKVTLQLRDPETGHYQTISEGGCCIG